MRVNLHGSLCRERSEAPTRNGGQAIDGGIDALHVKPALIDDALHVAGCHMPAADDTSASSDNHASSETQWASHRPPRASGRASG